MAASATRTNQPETTTKGTTPMRTVFSLEVENQAEADAIFAMLREYQEQGVPLATTADGAEVFVREPLQLLDCGRRYFDVLVEASGTDRCADALFEAFEIEPVENETEEQADARE